MILEFDVGEAIGFFLYLLDVMEAEHFTRKLEFDLDIPFSPVH